MESQTFSKGAVRVALSCTSKESGRYAFNAVHIEPGRMVATDGRRLVMVERADVPEGKAAATMLLHREPLEAAAKGAKVRDVAINGAVESKAANGTTLATFPSDVLEDGAFPDWTAVMPKARDMEGSVTVRLSPWLLGGILAAIDSASGNAPYVDIEVPAPDDKGRVMKPIRITAQLASGDRATAILMPIDPSVKR